LTLRLVALVGAFDANPPLTLFRFGCLSIRNLLLVGQLRMAVWLPRLRTMRLLRSGDCAPTTEASFHSPFHPSSVSSLLPPRPSRSWLLYLTPLLLGIHLHSGSLRIFFAALRRYYSLWPQPLVCRHSKFNHFLPHAYFIVRCERGVSPRLQVHPSVR